MNKYYEITSDDYENLHEDIKDLYEYVRGNYPKPENNISFRIKNNLNREEKMITTPTIKILNKICCVYCLDKPITLFKSFYEGSLCLCENATKHIINKTTFELLEEEFEIKKERMLYKLNHASQESIKEKAIEIIKNTHSINTERKSQKMRQVFELKFAVAKYFNNDREKITKFFDYCKITDVDKKENTFHITLVRPGVFIGRKGEMINSIIKHLPDNCDINLIEDNVTSLIDGILYYHDDY